MHLYVATVEVTHVLLLDESNEDGCDGVLVDGYDVDLGESVFDLGDLGVDFIACAWLHDATSLLILVTILALSDL